MSETLSRSPQHPSHQNLPLLGRGLPFYATEWWTLPVFAPDPTRREDRVKPSPYLPEWNSYLLRLVEKGEGELDRYSSITLHYGEVHSRHDRSTSYRSARRTLAYKASLLRRRNSSLIARASQQASKPLLTHLLIYSDTVWFSNSISSISRVHFFPILRVKGKM